MLLAVAVRKLTDYPQPDPLQKLRLQQLQAIQNELKQMESPDIRVSSAKLFLSQLFRFDQPLPSLYELRKQPATIIIQAPAPKLTESPADVINDLQTMGVADPVVKGLQSGAISTQELPRIRSEIAEYKNNQAVPGFDNNADAYNPADFVKRARTLCGQIREAFPGDEQALGCPATESKEITAAEARTLVYTVCGRIRETVPSVSTEQFNCPLR